MEINGILSPAEITLAAYERPRHIYYALVLLCGRVASLSAYSILDTYLLFKAGDQICLFNTLSTFPHTSHTRPLRPFLASWLCLLLLPLLPAPVPYLILYIVFFLVFLAQLKRDARQHRTMHFYALLNAYRQIRVAKNKGGSNVKMTRCGCFVGCVIIWFLFFILYFIF